MRQLGRGARVAGEFALIAVSVLVALAVDRWAAEREDHALERYYLETLLEDVRADSSSFQAELLRNRRALRSIEGLLVALELPVPSRPEGLLPVEQARAGGEDASIPVSVFFGILPHEQRVFRSSFDELVSSGRLGLIRDASIRRQLITYYTDIDRLAQAISTRTEDSRNPLRAVALAAAEAEPDAYPTRFARALSVNAASILTAYLSGPGLEAALRAAMYGLWEEQGSVLRKVLRNAETLAVVARVDS